MMKAVTGWLIVVLTSVLTGVCAQHVPIGAWRVHVSYHNLVDVLSTPANVFAAAPNGVMIVDKADKSVRFYDKGNGLSNSGISRIAYDATTDQLLVAYGNGTFDAVRSNRVRLHDPTRNTVLTGPKAINDIYLHGSLAYLATDYGVLIFDLARSEIKETWRDLGENGTTLRILATAVSGDSVFLATESGVIAGNLNENLLDFSKWERFVGSDVSQMTTSIAAVGDVVFTSVPDEGMYAYQGGRWEKVDALPSESFANLTAAQGKLIFTNKVDAWVFDPANGSSARYNSIDAPFTKAIVDDANALWIATDGAGLATNTTGSFSSILPNGPAFNETMALYHNAGNLYVVGGGFTPSYQPSSKAGVASIFQNGAWSSVRYDVADLTSIAINDAGRKFFGSFGFGVIDSDGNGNRIWDETNSSLINAAPPQRNVAVTSVAATRDGLWVANYGVTPALHFLTYETDQWQAFSFPYGNARYPVKVHADFRDNVWVVLNPDNGGGLISFDKSKNEHISYSVQAGQGALPSNRVYEVTSDRDGNVWVGTDAGVAYFFDKNNDAVKPIFENRFLLRDDVVRAIAVDGGNRKWMGTDRGVWLFNSTGEEAIANFTEENSPLPSNRILDIEIDPATGEVFFATDRGMASFRSNATTGDRSFQTVKIFPNPVTNMFNGEVGISGLAMDAVVKITDMSGRLIRETRANGGSASWDVRDARGRRVDTGIYLVMAVAFDGTESIVGKIAVVN